MFWRFTISPPRTDQSASPGTADDATLSARNRILPGQPLRDFENRYLCKDGSFRWLSWSVHPQLDTQQVIGVVRDVTDRKRDEAERRLLEARVLRAQRMEGIGTLAGGIAHDLNNVFAPIILSIAVLKDEPHTETQRETLDLIDACAQRGADMVRQVLSYARGVEGQRVVLTIAAVVRDVLQLVSDRLTANVQIHTSLPEHSWAFAGDSTQIQQVLLNLLLNARDAMPGGGTITIAARNAELGAGASHFLAKPFTADALLTTRDGAERGIGGSAGLSMGALGAMRASALLSR